MHKLKSMPHLLPRSIKELFPDNIPKFGSSYEENAEWLSIYSGLNLRPSIFYKGPILAITEQAYHLPFEYFLSEYLQEIGETCTIKFTK